MRACPGEGRGQLGAAVVGTLAQDGPRAAHRPGQPRRRLGRKVGAPGRDVQHRDGLARHGVAHGHARTDPLVKAHAPVLGPADQDGSRRLERRAHPVRARRPLRPARPRRHVAVPRAMQRLLVALDGQDPPRPVGHGDDAADALDLARDRRRGAAELGEHDLVLERVLGGILVLRGRCRRLAETRVDPVLLAAAIPGRRHLGPDATHAVVPGEEPLARRGHGLVALRVAACDGPLRSGSYAQRRSTRHRRRARIERPRAAWRDHPTANFVSGSPEPRGNSDRRCPAAFRRCAC